MNEKFLIILMNCDILPTNREQKFLTFEDTLNLSSCSEILRKQIETRYEMLFKNHYPNLKDLNLIQSYGTWLNIFKCFKQTLICDEILQLIDLNIEECIEFIPIFPIINCEFYHVVQNNYAFKIYPKISGNMFANYTTECTKDLKLINKLNSLKNNKIKSIDDFMQHGFFPFSINKLNYKIKQILDTSRTNIGKIIFLIKNQNFDNPIFTDEDLIEQFTQNHLTENCDQNFKETILNFMKNLCKIYTREFSLENIFELYRNYYGNTSYFKEI